MQTVARAAGQECTVQQLARSLGRHPEDGELTRVINAMVVSGYLRRNGSRITSGNPLPTQQTAHPAARRLAYATQLDAGLPPMTPLAPGGEWPNGPVTVRAADLEAQAVWFPLHDQPDSYHIKAFNDHRQTRCHSPGWLQPTHGSTAYQVRTSGGTCCNKCRTIVVRNDQTPALPQKQAVRYRCEHADVDEAGHQHTAGVGQPRRSHCQFCRGELVLEHGRWGVFHWNIRGHYPAEAAVRTYLSEQQADDDASTHDGMVARWIRDPDRPGPAGVPPGQQAADENAPIFDRDGNTLQMGDMVWVGTGPRPVLYFVSHRNRLLPATCQPDNVPLAGAPYTACEHRQLVRRADPQQTEANYTLCTNCGFVYGPTNTGRWSCIACGADSDHLEPAERHQQILVDAFVSRLLTGPVDHERLHNALDDMRRTDLSRVARRLQLQVTRAMTPDHIRAIIAQDVLGEQPHEQLIDRVDQEHRAARARSSGNLVTHEPKQACHFGLWHEGFCDPPATGQQFTALDGAVVRIVPEKTGYRVDCSTCGYVMSGSAAETDFIAGEASTHVGWHTDEESVRLARLGGATPQQRAAAAERMNVLNARWMRKWPLPDGRGWVDWSADPRVVATPAGYEVTKDWRTVSICPAYDGSPDWIATEDTTTVDRRYSSYHAALLGETGEIHPDAIRTLEGPYTRRDIYNLVANGATTRAELAHQLGIQDGPALRHLITAMKRDGQLRRVDGLLLAGNPPRQGPSGVPFPGDAPGRAPVHVEPRWLTGVEHEDTLTRMGKCPYQTGSGGWGDPLDHCGADRIGDPADGPFCGPHAQEIRDQGGDPAR